MNPLPRYWWSNNSDEFLWLEISDREDFGVDLNHRVERKDGSLMPSFGLARDEIDAGDIVFHYDLVWDGIRSWSRVAGPFQEEGGAWAIDLNGPYRLRRAVPFNRLFDAEWPIKRLFESLPNSQEQARHLPFIFDPKGLRLAETYLAKLPREIVGILPQLSQPFNRSGGSGSRQA